MSARSCPNGSARSSRASSRSTSRRARRSGRRRSSSAPGFGVSPSTVRAELAELERLGLLTHPHTSAGRVPTEAGYRRLRRRAARAAGAAAGGGSRSSSPTRAGRGRRGAPGDDRDALAGHAAARARLGAAARGGDGPARRRAPAAAERRGRRRDHVGGRGDEAALHVPGAGRPGLVTWAGDYLRERVTGLRLRSRLLARAFDEPGLAPRERAFLAVVRGAFDELEDERELYVGGAAGLLDDLRTRGDRRLPEPDRRAREARRAARRARAVARGAAAVRPRRRRARGVGAALARARRRDLRLREPAARRGQPARPAADGLREGAPRGPRPRPTSSRASSRRSTPTSSARPARAPPRLARCRPDVDHRTRLLRAARRLRATPTSRRSRRPSASSRASCILTSPSTRRPRCASARSPRPTRRSRTPRRASSTTATATPGFARAASSRRHFDLGSFGDLFSAFFGEDLFGRAAGAAAARAAPTSSRRSRSSSSRRRTASSRRRSRSSAPPPAAPAAATAPRPASTIVACPRCGGSGRAPAGLAQHPRRVRPPVGLPGVRRQRAAGSSSPARRATAPAARSRSAALEVEIPAGIHDGQRIRITGEGHAGALGGRPGDAYVQVRVRRRRALRARGQRHLLPGRPDDRPGRARRDRAPSRRSTARSSSSSSRARSRARSACSAARGCPCSRASAAATTASSSTSPCRAASPTEQRRLLEEFERADATTTPTSTTQASSRS